MAEHRIKNSLFNRPANQLEIPSCTLNYITRHKIMDRFSIYQRSCNIVEFLPLTRNNTFKLKSIEGEPILWQKGSKSCKKYPMGNIDIVNGGELKPCSLSLFAKWCPKEVYDSCFKCLYEYTRAGDINYGEVDTKLIAPVIKEFLSMAVRAKLSLAFLGQLFDLENIDFEEGSANEEVLKNFAKQHDACMGLLKKIQVKYPSRIAKDCFPDEVKDGCIPDIDVCELFDCLLCNGGDQLSNAIMEGYMEDGNGGQVEAMLILSNNLIPALFHKLKTESKLQLSNKDLLPTIERRRENIGGRKIWIYEICGVKVIPLSALCSWNKYLAGKFYFAALTTSRNIQFGSNFGSFYEIEGESIGVTIERETRIKDGDKGLYTMDSEALMAVDLACPDLFYGAWQYYPNAKKAA